jgi:type I restriction enzyme M protein
MAEAAWCGHDSRGRRIPRDDAPSVIRNYLTHRDAPRKLQASPLGFTVASADLKPGVLAPRAYDPDISELLRELENSHILVRFGDLVKQGVLAVSTGDEVGKLAYGTGEVPFVRTSDLSGWEIKVDPKHGLSRGIFEAIKAKQDVQAGDVLMVRDGTYLIGTCALVTKHDVDIVLQSHIYKIRVQNNELVDPYLLLALLSSPIVQRQIRSHSQTQDIIDSLGNRIHELILPIPRDPSVRQDVSQVVQRIIRERVEARELAREVIEKVASPQAQSR